MQNADIARIFDELGDLLELDGANSFRVRAYRNASRTLEELSEPVAEMARDRAKLQELEGIGKDLAEKIVVIVETGSLPQLEQLREKIPVGVLQMMKISGVGPKKAAALFKELNIRNLEELRVAAEGDQISGLKGFGKKTQQAILEGLEHVERSGLRVLLPEAKAQADAIVGALSALESIANVSAAGSVRRRRETVADLDVLAACAEPGPPMDLLAAHPLVEKVLSRGDTKMRVRLRSSIELDLRVVPESSYGAALQYFTGSKEHNIIVRRRAQERGLKVNEYGVFRGDDQIAGRTEDDVYAALDLPWFPPELREGRSEFERAESGKLPRLIELADIQGDLHMHTTATDGHASIQEMAESAKAHGLKYIAITDHSKRVTMANGLNADRLREHWKEIEKVRKKVAGIEILKGIECDILEGGALDLPDDVLAEADWVIAVLHYGLKQPQEEIHMRLLNAIRSPYVSIIGHPTARIVGGRPPVAVDMDVILKAAADHGVMMEINADPHRLDLNDIHAAAARDRGIPIVISTDSHNVRGFEVLEYGIYQARRAGLEAKDVANTRSFAEFKKLLRR